jgi:translocation and assembly module TamB
MTHPTEPGNEPESNPQSPGENPGGDLRGTPLPARGRRWRTLLPVGGVLLVGTVAGVWWGLHWVNHNLAPLVAKNLSRSLERPVNLGPLERFSLTGLRFGRSAIPPTATDPDQVSLEAIEVGFDPIKILTTRDLNLDVTLVKPRLRLEQDAQGLWVSTKIEERKEEGPVKIVLKSLRFQDADLALVPTRKVGKGLAAAIALTKTNGRVDFWDRNQRITYQLQGQAATGGQLDLSGETRVKPLKTILRIKGQDMAVADIDRLIKLPINLPTGRADGNLEITILPNEKHPNITGTATVRQATLQIPRAPTAITQIAGNLRFKGAEIRLEQVKARYGTVPFQAMGTMDTRTGFNLGAKVPAVDLSAVVKTLNLTLPFAATGAITADLKLTGALTQPRLTGTARSTKVSTLDLVALSRVSTEFEFDPQAMLVRFPSIAATPVAGGRVIGSGQVQLGTVQPGTSPGTSPDSSPSNSPQLAFNFQAADVSGDAIAPAYNDGNPLPITLGPLSAQVQITGPATNPQTLVRWQAPAATYAGAGEILIAGGRTTLRTTQLNVAGGTVNVAGQAFQGKWQGIAVAQKIPLKAFSADLRGNFNGQFNLAGSLDSFRPAAIRAQGEATFSEGLSVIRQPITAQVQWDGQKLAVQRATAPGFSATGAVFAQLEGAGAPAITGLDLNVRASDLNLQDLAIPTPSTIQLAGRTDFSGRITGSAAAPRVTGKVNLRDLIVNGTAFEKQMQGTVTVAQGVDIKLAGANDRIALTLNANNQVTAFNVRQGNAIATGTGQGDLLNIQAQNLPLALLVPRSTAALLNLGGELNGTLAVNVAQMAVAGQVNLKNPEINGFRASQFGGRISFANGVATLTETILTRGQTTVQLDGRANILSADPQIKGRVKVVQGRLQDVLQLAQLFDLEDLTPFKRPISRSKADLTTVPVDLANASIFNRLRRLAEVQAFFAKREQERQEALIPDLREVQGNFSADVSVEGSLRAGLDTTFKLEGQDWQWGPSYRVKRVIAEGSSAKGVVTLVPLRFQTDDALVAFSGQLGGAKQSGQFRMENVPLGGLTSLAERVLKRPLPLSLDGKLNATATLSGNFENPQAIGELALVDGTLNNNPVQQAQGSFSYTNARFGFGSNIAITGQEPLIIAGSIPAPIPLFNPPTDETLDVTIKVKNDGLALMNLLTSNLVVWESGEGQVDLKISGKTDQPIVEGRVDVANATIQARAIPGKLTGVTGNLMFDADRLLIRDQLKAQFSQGEVVVSGGIPIFTPVPPDSQDPTSFLQVNLNKIALRLKGIYQGGVGGNVQVTGTALAPVIGGEIRLQEGQVLLADQPEAPTAEDLQNQSPVQFQNLTLLLGDRVRVTRQPILNFLASGKLTINGSLSDLQPEGTIRLNAGQVNLFTTQFNLLRGYPQTAEFVATQGLDPNLDIRLIASLPETTGGRLPDSALSAEISESLTPTTRFGGVQTVRVQAHARGIASQLFDNLELTSSPARSRAEIVALLGGGFVATLGRGDTTLGIANLAGSALLTNIQTVIGNALGLSEFRLFPTLTQESRGRESRSSSSLGLAAEAAIDITPTISLSALKILTSDDPTQFGLRYRLNENFLVRSSSDFSGDSRAVVEYEARF